MLQAAAVSSSPSTLRWPNVATRLKTIEYCVPTLAALPDNTLTALPRVTLYCPEFNGMAGTVTWKSCIVTASFKQLAGHVLGNINSRRIDVSVNGAAVTSYTNANLYTNSGEQIALYHAGDCTADFVNNWAAFNTATLDISVLVDDASATPVWGSVDVTLTLTYEYSDTIATQIKTVYIPLDAPVGALANSKPGSATDTIPALDTELPEATKTIRSMFIVCQGNTQMATGTTDCSLSMQVDGYTAYSSATLEQGLASDIWQRYVAPLLYYDGTPLVQGIGMTTNATHGFYIWGSVAKFNHQQVYLVITYEFDATADNDVFVSCLIPMHLESAWACRVVDRRS
jgi:hypothetical protein